MVYFSLLEEIVGDVSAEIAHGGELFEEIGVHGDKLFDRGVSRHVQVFAQSEIFLGCPNFDNKTFLGCRKPVNDFDFFVSERLHEHGVRPKVGDFDRDQSSRGTETAVSAVAPWR